MNAAHLHLMVNHIPVLGVFFALALLAVGHLKDSPPLIRAALGTFALVGVAAVGVYLTGEPAEELMEGMAGVSEVALESHEERALRAMLATALVGLIALWGLVRYQAEAVGRRFLLLTTLLGLVAASLLAWTADEGGRIRHPELRGEAVRTEAS